MPKKLPKDRIHRFAVGDKGEPYSSVWRLFSNHRYTDCYLSTLKKYSDVIHFSIHNSGQCHLKLNDKTHQFPQPVEKLNHYECFELNFPGYNLKSQLKKPNEIAKTKEVNWYSRPEYSEVRVFKIVLKREPILNIESDEVTVSHPVRSLLYDKRVYAFLVSQVRGLSEQEIEYVEDEKQKFKIRCRAIPKVAHVDALLLYANHSVWAMPIDAENFEVGENN